MAKESRREDFRVVDDKHVARTQQRGQFRKLAVGDCPGSTIQMQEARGATLDRGFLGDQFWGQCEIEIGKGQPEKSICGGRSGAATA